MGTARKYNKNESNLKVVDTKSTTFKPLMRAMEKHTLNPDIWVDSYADYLFNYAIGRIDDADLVKDLVQETFLAGLKSAKNFKGDAAERTWLIAILKRKIIDHYRKSNSKKGKAEVRMSYNSGDSDRTGDWLEEQIADASSSYAKDAIENRELGQAIQACIAKLPKKQGLVFTMKTIKGMETETICNELGINASNLWVMIHRARTSLMGCLDKSWF